MDKFLEKLIEIIPFAKWLIGLGIPEGVIVVLPPLITALLVPLIITVTQSLRDRLRSAKAAKDLHPYFDYQSVKKARNLYIPTRIQNISPAAEEEPGFTVKFVTSQPAVPFFIHTAFNEKRDSNKYYLVLADSGMGKTTFMINLYLAYTSFFNFNKKYTIKLLPFGDNRIIDHIKKLSQNRDTILLLDAFDEYKGLLPPEPHDGLTTDERFRLRLDEIVELTQDFREVVITSRTQYFPGQEDQPYELKIPRYNDQGFHTLGKLYISPFNEPEIKKYLRKKFGSLPWWNRQKKKIAEEVVKQSPKLMVRPMLLSYIDYLVQDGKTRYNNTFEIYDALIEKWLHREAGKRKYESATRAQFKKDLYDFSKYTALHIYENRAASGSNGISEEQGKQICKNHNLDLNDYEITGQSLLTRDSHHNWKFSHRSIYEFFLAKHAESDINFAWNADFTGLDMATLFASELGLSSMQFANYQWIKGGDFIMGSPEIEEVDREKIETQHEVSVADFYLCKFTVTLSDFKQFIENTQYQTDADKGGGSYVWNGKEWIKKEGINWRCEVNGKIRSPQNHNHPIIHISWNDAQAYCEWLSSKLQAGRFRLPTEAEWEYACRAGTLTPFNTGDNLTTDQANYNGNYPYHNNKKGLYRKNTLPVNALPANAWGLYHMHGNVWEWCQDWYHENYYEQCKALGKIDNPAGPAEGSYRVVRGGSWFTCARHCRSADRGRDAPDSRSSGTGFRLVFVP